MAMIDYGAIAWKDGKLISTDMFTAMEDMVGWSDNSKHRLDGRNRCNRKLQAFIQDSIKGSGIFVSVMFPGNMYNNSASHTIHDEKRDAADTAIRFILSGFGTER